MQKFLADPAVNRTAILTVADDEMTIGFVSEPVS